MRKAVMEFMNLERMRTNIANLEESKVNLDVKSEHMVDAEVSMPAKIEENPLITDNQRVLLEFIEASVKDLPSPDSDLHLVKSEEEPQPDPIQEFIQTVRRHTKEAKLRRSKELKERREARLRAASQLIHILEEQMERFLWMFNAAYFHPLADTSQPFVRLV